MNAYVERTLLFLYMDKAWRLVIQILEFEVLEDGRVVKDIIESIKKLSNITVKLEVLVLCNLMYMYTWNEDLRQVLQV